MFQSRPLDEISIADIRGFINERHRESEILDYKGPWPNDLAKVIAAMANTQGGLILIGVPEIVGDTGLPDQPTGVPIERGINTLRQRVISTAYDSIYPPVIPEVEAYQMDDRPDHAVVIVRVSPSDQTPHAVDNRRKVYVRVDSQSQPELYRLATIDELQWLFNKREKGEKYLTDLIEAAQARSEAVLSEGFDPLIDPLENTFPTLEVWIAPRFYFSGEAFSRNEAQLLLTGNSERSTLLNGDWLFPGLAIRADAKRSVPMGYCIYATEASQRRREVYEYDEICTSGIIFTKMRIRWTENEHEGYILPIEWILPHLDGLMKFADRSFRNSRLSGLLQVKARLSGLSDAVLRLKRDQWLGDLREKHVSLDYSIDLLDKSIDLSELNQAHLSLVKEAASRLLWAFGYDWTDEAFERWWNGIRK